MLINKILKRLTSSSSLPAHVNIKFTFFRRELFTTECSGKGEIFDTQWLNIIPIKWCNHLMGFHVLTVFLGMSCEDTNEKRRKYAILRQFFTFS